MPNFTVAFKPYLGYNIDSLAKVTSMLDFDKNELYLFPAYGRRYFDFEQATKDWHEGKDFSINGFGGPYCSIRDLELLQEQYTKVFLVSSAMDLLRIS